jgi:GT2 family glycosyltransferase
MSSDTVDLDRLGVVVLSYGSSNQQDGLVQTLVAEGVPPSRVLVVHNPDGTPHGARPAARAGVAVQVRERNEGYGPAMNVGIEYWLERGAEWVLLLTHDVRTNPGALQELLRVASRHARCGVVGAVLVDAATGRPFSYGGVDMPHNIVGHLEEPPQSPDGLAPCGWVDGSIMLLRANAYRDAGPLESRFFMYFEEPDFCARVRRAGWQVGVALKASALTQPGLTARPFAYGYLFCRNGLLYAWRTGGRRGVARAIRSQLRMAWWLAAKPYNRRFYSSTWFVRFGWPKAAGILLGLLSAARGRWGPPPRLVQRLSDIAGT